MSEYIYSFDGVTEQGIETYMRREEIIRCRDCTVYDGEGYGCSYGRGDDPDGFCAWGERKEVSDLLPCPFCGGEAELTGFEAPEYWVWCPNCKASTDAHTCKQPAIDAWNTRAAYEADEYFYLPKPKQGICYTSETMVQRTEHGYQMGAIADVYENAVKEWQKQINDRIIGRICEVFRPERTCRNESEPPTGFLCSACGWGDFNEPTHLLTGAKYTGQIHGGPNYCPNCGAKVIGGNE